MNLLCTKKHILLCFILGISSIITTKAQTVTGIVKSADENQPLPGVTVQVQGTANGTTTNEDGQYELSNVKPEDSLIFSFIGFKEKTVSINGKTNIDIFLSPGISSLNQVVVVGFGTQKKVNVTGAISQISSKQIQSQPVTNTLGALRGLAPNLNITATGTGGASDATKNINIRGIGSINGSSPYILINGVRATQFELATMNPDNIETISVLKGPAASAIYGAHGAFGVILVTTKSGRNGQDFTINYSNNFRVTRLINVPQTVSSVKYMKVALEAYENYGESPIFTKEQVERAQRFLDGEIENMTKPLPGNPSWWRGIEGGASNGWKSGYANTDWWDLLFKDTKLVQKHNLSITGGSDNTTYYISGGLLGDPGQFKYGDKNENYSRYNLNSKVSVNVTDWLKVTNINRYSRINSSFPVSLSGQSQRGRLYHDINRFPPFTPWKTPPVKDAQGNIIVPQQLALLAGWNENNGFNKNTNTYYVISLGAKLDLTKNLFLKSKVNYKKHIFHNTLNFKKWTLLGPDGSPEVIYQGNNNKIKKSVSIQNYFSYDVTVNYKKSILGNHNFKILIGYQQESKNREELQVARTNTINNNLNSINITAGNILDLDNPISTFGSLGTLARFQYNYKQKYIFEFDGRYDGSSKFPKGHRFVFSPSASVGYNISRESFWQPIRKYIDNFKIRASYGTLANQEVSNFLYVSSIPIHSRLGYIIDGIRPIYTTPANISSNDITWETVTSSNIGTDISLFDYRLTVTGDYYVRVTSNMFGPSRAVSAVLGTSAPETNSATLKTKGWGLSIGWHDQINNSLSYNINVSLSNNSSVITEYNNPTKSLSDYYVGMTIGEIWGYRSDGLFQTKKGVDNYLKNVDMSQLGSAWAPGDVKYIDLNGDEVVNNGNNTATNSGDRVIIGNSHPQYVFSFHLGMSWRDISLSMYWQGVGKKDIWPDRFSALFWGWNRDAHTIIQPASLNYWSKDNPDAYLPRPLAESALSTGFYKDRWHSDRYLQNAAFMRLRSLQISYTLPSSLTHQLHIKNMQVFINGSNLLTITNMWPGIDPAIAGNDRDDTYSDPAADGNYPLSQSFGVGINLTF